MKTTGLINLLQSVEYGASGRPREISLMVDGIYMSDVDIVISSTGDGVAGAQLCLLVKRKGFEINEKNL